MLVIGFGLSFLISCLTLPLVRWGSSRVGKVSLPRQDRWHRTPTPTLGGIGIFLAAAVGLIALDLYGVLPNIHWSLILAPLGMFILGLLDDFKRLSPAVKLTGQLIASVVVIYFGGLTIRFFPWPVANLLLTLFWLIGITNAINLLDNMDGIAGGVSLIAAGFLGFGFWQVGTQGPLALAVCLGGSLLGFLIFNFPPARIFMGDSGSMFLGFSLAMLAIVRSSQASNVIAILAVPVLVFLAPILDTLLVTVTRALRGQSPLQGGTDHTTHRLVSFGLDSRQVALILYGVAFLGGFSGVALEQRDYTSSLVLIPLVLIVLALFTAYLGRIKVVAHTQNTAPAGILSKLVIDLTFRRQVFEILLDLSLVGFSYYLAYWTLGGLDMDQPHLALFAGSWPLVMFVSLIVMRFLGVYRAAWGFLDTIDFLRFGLSAGISGIFSYLFFWLIPYQAEYPLEAFILFSLFLFFSVAGSRASFRLVDRLVNQMRLGQAAGGVLIIGAGVPGEMVLRWLENNASPQNGVHLKALGIIESDPSYSKRSLRQVQVLGTMDNLQTAIIDKRPVGLIISAPDLLTAGQLQVIVDTGRDNKIWVREMRIHLEDIDQEPDNDVPAS
jgi:UDP-GlcNAc:undecaprenyl-phosphate GlcNAc-1-phosphate transferase